MVAGSSICRPSTDAHSLSAGTAPWRRGPEQAGTQPAEGDDRSRDRSCTDPGEGSPEGRGRGRRSGRAGVGNPQPVAVRDAGANDSLPSCHHNSPGEGAGCAHGTHPDSHPCAGYIHAAGRAGRSRPPAAHKDDAATANGPGGLWGRRVESVQRLADRTKLMGWQPYIGNAGDAGVLELATVQLLDGGSQVGSRLKLDKARTGVSASGPCAFGGLTYPSLLPLRLVSE
jgi:hypothetical protein